MSGRPGPFSSVESIFASDSASTACMCLSWHVSTSSDVAYPLGPTALVPLADSTLSIINDIDCAIKSSFTLIALVVKLTNVLFYNVSILLLIV